jgi:hypothetical protein
LTRLGLAVIMLTLAGCTSWSPARHPPADLFAKADQLVVRGDYSGALKMYDDIVLRFPEETAADRARAVRRALVALEAAEAETARLRREGDAREGELLRLRHDLAGRDGELQRLREELTLRQAELQRVAAEAERLRADLEKLKRIDLDLERRR